jgi:tetratricopeptide (TPR) repeat protein
LELYDNEPRGALQNQLGITFRHLSAEEEALICYDRALHASRLSAGERRDVIFNISNIYKDRGNRLAKSGDYSGAVAAFTKALEYDPQNAIVAYNVGVIYVNYLNRPDLGLPFLESYLKQNPSDQNAADLVRAIRGR